MIRDLDRLSGTTFDVLVVGGGIYGLTIAYDAAQRGLSVALIERDDFGSGASFNHLRTIHGGLRYLRTLDLARARESVRERRTLARIAPHAVEPLRFALPVYRSLTRGRVALTAALLLDRVVSADRNRGVPPSHRLPGGRVVSRSTAIQQFPALRRRHLRGAAVWYDYVTLEPDRLTFSWALAASQQGAVLANHVEAIEILRERGAGSPGTPGRVEAVRAIDRCGNREIEIAARVTVNATGGQVDRLLGPLGISAGVPMLNAMNLVTRRDAGEEALGGFSASGRALFMVPWRDRALFGTWEAGRTCDGSAPPPNEQDVTSFVAELNQAFPALDLTVADITLVHHGNVPAAVRDGGVTLEGHERIRDHAQDGVEGLLTVAGAKYTTARAVAERVTDLLMRKLQREPVRCRTASTVLPGGSVRDVGLAIAEARREHDEGLPSDTIPHLLAAYGSRYREVLDLAGNRRDLRSRIAPGLPVIGAELALAARSEMAITLADAAVRRTPVGALGDPGDEALDRAAAIVGAELNWSGERRSDEIGALKRLYGTVKALKT
jgi:glycerol-3-phosphate dehydrogenase